MNQQLTGSDLEHSRVYYDLVVMAASAGGLEAIGQVLSCLPSDFGAAVVIVLHLAPHHKSRLAEVLSRRTLLPVKQVTDQEHILPGYIYVSPPDFHTLIREGGLVSLEQSEPVNFTRPSADRLFESAAAWFGRRAIAVVLSGMGQDGSQGITAVKQAGGTVIAQDKATSEFFGMPGSAIRSGLVDLVLPLSQIPQAINQLVRLGAYQL